MNDTTVIVGARAAGAMTALHLARRGHRVLIVDRAGPPADVLSTHLLMRSGVYQLRRAGLLDGIVAAGTPLLDTLTLGFGDTVKSFSIRERFGVDAYAAPRRTALDSYMLDAALEAGAEFRRMTVSGVTRNPSGRVDGVVGDGDSPDPIRIPARFVIGADGMRSQVAQAVNARTLVEHPVTAAVIYSYFDIDQPLFDVRYVPGWASGAATTSSEATMVYAGFPTPRLRGDTEATFRRALLESNPQLAELVHGASRLERFRRTPGVPTFLKEAHGPGWALVGDAGFTKDPATAHGISCAMRDAELVARAISASLSDPRVERAAFGEFQSIRDRFAAPLIEHGVGLASYEWDAAGASRHMAALGEVNDDECAFFERLDAAEAA